MLQAIPLSPQAHQALVTMPALRGLAAADRDRVEAHCREECWPAGTVVFREGDPGTSLYVVVSGEVDVRVGERTIARLGAGEWLGETALVTGEPRSATVVVALDCRLLVLDTSAFGQLLEAQPHLYEELAGILGRRLSVTARGTNARHYEIVLIDNRGRWGSRRTVVEEVAAALEQELGRAVAIVTLAARAGVGRPTPRADRPDAVLTGEVHENGALRERIATRVAAVGLEAPIVLVEIEDELAAAAEELADLADTVLVLAGSDEPTRLQPSAKRVIALHDRRLGRVPALSSIAHARVAERGARSRSHAGPDRARAHASLRGDRPRQRRRVRPCPHRRARRPRGGGHPDRLRRRREPGRGRRRALCPRHDAEGDAPPGGRLRRPAQRWPRDPAPRRPGDGPERPPPGMFSGERFLGFLEASARRRAVASPTCAFRSARSPPTSRPAPGSRSTREPSPRNARDLSAPGLLTPHLLDGRLLIDGGMCDPVPAETVRSMGADLVVAVNVVPALDPATRNSLDAALRLTDWINPLSYVGGRRPLPNGLDVAVRTWLIMQRELGNARAGEADVLVTPSLGQYWAFDFWNAEAMITAGVVAAEAAMPAVQTALRRRREAGA